MTVAGSRVAQRIAGWLGLQFRPGREAELARGLAAAARELGVAPEALGQTLLAGEPDAALLQLLARHLTIGETYFFRDAPLHDALARRILPALVHARRATGRRLRIWSAGCATGEEPYSLAMLLHPLLPDLDDWQLSLVGTDVNADALRKAEAGRFGVWSFRATPPLLRDAWFEPLPDGRRAIAPRIRAMVNFRPLNLARPDWAAPAAGMHGFDLVLCRNVLMYFAPDLAQRVLLHLQDAVADGGWLVLGPGEASVPLPPGLEQVAFSGTLVYRRRSRATAPARSSTPVPPKVPANATAQVPARVSATLTRPARGARPSLPPSVPVDACARQARLLADQGRLAEARAWCERWIAADRVDACAHYLHGMLLMAEGQRTAAAAALRRTLFLDPGFVLAHVAAGQLARSAARDDDALRHFRAARRLLQRHADDELLPHGEGLTAGGLNRTLAELLAVERLT
ncbi:MAG TPA: CheR family methyltransferase [Ramlibacter sp.]|nr:CheR family methyltransferase [Ramlibacter sp.]